jgi:hypothetical protein
MPMLGEENMQVGDMLNVMVRRSAKTPQRYCINHGRVFRETPSGY